MKKLVKKKTNYIKIRVLLSYGVEQVKDLITYLGCSNTDEKLDAINNIYSNNKFNPNQKLFVIQKLLILPKKVRESIALQLIESLNNPIAVENNENNI